MRLTDSYGCYPHSQHSFLSRIEGSQHPGRNFRTYPHHLSLVIPFTSIFLFLSIRCHLLFLSRMSTPLQYSKQTLSFLFRTWQINEGIFNKIFNNWIALSFLFLLCVLLSFSCWSLVCCLFLTSFSFSLQSSSLFLHDFFVLFHCFRVHFDGCMAQTTVIAIPMLSHKGSRSTWWAGFALLSHIPFSWIKDKLPSTLYKVRVRFLIFLWMCLFFFLVV